MTIISVDKDLLAQEAANWGVPANYFALFVRKSREEAGRIILSPFCFNDTEHMTIQRHWLALNAALWCVAYREAETKDSQIEALASIRALFYVAGLLGRGEIITLLQLWWRETFALHNVPAPNFSAAIKQPAFH